MIFLAALGVYGALDCGMEVPLQSAGKGLENKFERRKYHPRYLDGLLGIYWVWYISLISWDQIFAHVCAWAGQMYARIYADGQFCLLNIGFLMCLELLSNIITLFHMSFSR